MRILNSLFAAVGLALTLCANAQTSTFPEIYTETFSGQFQISELPPFGTKTRTEQNALTPGGSTLPASLASTNFTVLFPTWSTNSFPVTGTLFGGNASDTYSAEIRIDSYVQRGTSNIWDISGSFVYTGGSGVYAGIGGGGTLSGFDTLDASATSGTTFRVLAVPEPSTYAMMLAGLALLGFIARRRQR